MSDGTVKGTLSLLPLHREDGRFGVSEFLWRPALARVLVWRYSDEYGVSMRVTAGTPRSTKQLQLRQPWFLHQAGGRVVTSAVDRKHGRELWVTDGTRTGTRLLRDILVGRGSSTPAGTVPHPEAREHRGRLIFTAEDGTHGRELWVTDGTRKGTRLLKDIRQGARGSDPRTNRPVPDYLSPEGFLVFRGRLYFTADDGVHGRELWTTDGTRMGTRIVKDIWEGGSGSSIEEIEIGDGRMEFWADDGSGGDLWVSDGTQQGTHRQAS